MLIFLADSNKPYFKPKVNITKDVLPRYVCLSSQFPSSYILLRRSYVLNLFGSQKMNCLTF